MSDIRDYIKIANAFGLEARKIAELREDWIDDALAGKLGIQQNNQDTSWDANSPDWNPSVEKPADGTAVGEMTAEQQAEAMRILGVQQRQRAEEREAAARAAEDEAESRAAEQEAEAARQAEEEAARIQREVEQAESEAEAARAAQEAEQAASEAENAPQAQTTAPEQPAQPEQDTAPEMPTADNPELEIIRRNAGLPPAEPAAETPPAGNNPDEADPTAQTDPADAAIPPAGNNPDEADPNDADSTDSGTPPAGNNPDEADPNDTGAPQTDAENDADSADNATPQGDPLAGRLDTQTPSLLDAYNDGGRQAMDNVRDLQQGLERLGFDPNGVDGKYGRGTYAAVQEFQRQNGLTVDGEAGPATMAKLQELLNAGSTTPAPQTDAENDADSQDNAPVAEPTAQTDPADAAIPPAGNNPDEADPNDADSQDNAPEVTQTGTPDMPNGGAAPEILQADVDRINALLTKFAQENASTNFAHLLAIVEGKLTEALEPAEVEELQALVDKYKDNPAFDKDILSRAQAAIAASRPAATGNTSGNPTPANTNAGKPAQPDFAKQARDQEALNKKVQADADAKDPRPIVKDRNGNPVKDRNGNPVRSRSPNQIWWDDNMQGTPFPGEAAAQKEIDKRKAQGDKNWNSIKNFFSGKPNSERDGQERGVQTASKDYSMKKYIKENKELDECGTMPPSPQQGSPVSMNVTLNASGEQNVQELIRMMQLAGASNAAPVADMHMGPADGHDDMVKLMRMADEDYMPEEAVEEDWDNTPQEDYKDHKYMTKDLSGGLNREKKAYAKSQDGDNAMAVESTIKEQLLAALEGKYANDAQRKAIHANKDKKKK